MSQQKTRSFGAEIDFASSGEEASPPRGSRFDIINGPGKWDLAMYLFERVGRVGDRREITFEAEGLGFFELRDTTLKPIGLGEDWELEGLALRITAGGYGQHNRCKIQFRTDKRSGWIELNAD